MKSTSLNLAVMVIGIGALQSSAYAGDSTQPGTGCVETDADDQLDYRFNAIENVDTGEVGVYCPIALEDDSESHIYGKVQVLDRSLIADVSCQLRVIDPLAEDLGSYAYTSNSTSSSSVYVQSLFLDDVSLGITKKVAYFYCSLPAPASSNNSAVLGYWAIPNSNPNGH